MTRTLLLFGLVALAASSLASAQAGIRPAIAPGTRPEQLQDVGVTERLGSRVRTDTKFRTHEGRELALSEIFDGHGPVVLQFVYHTCPTFCSTALDGLLASVSQQAWTAGEQFKVVSVSMDPRDTPQVAADSRARIVGRYGRDTASLGWNFLTGDQASIARLAEDLGYSFHWDEATQQFAHPGVLMVLSPSGKIARYLYGVEYAANDLRLSLVEADQERTLSTVEKILMYCYRYDSHESKYVLVAWRVMQIGGGITAVGLFGVLSMFWRREVLRRGRISPPGEGDSADDPEPPPRNASRRESLSVASRGVSITSEVKS